MKKFMTFLAATVLSLSMTATVFAGNNQTVVSMEIDESIENYELVIPPTLKLDPVEKTGTLKIELKNVNLVWSNGIHVYVNSANPDTESGKGAFLVNTQDSNKKIHYNFYAGLNQLYKGEELMTLDYFYDQGSNSYLTQDNGIRITVDGQYPGGGTYADTFTFRVEVVQ